MNIIIYHYLKVKLENSCYLDDLDHEQLHLKGIIHQFSLIEILNTYKNKDDPSLLSLLDVHYDRNVEVYPRNLMLLD